MFFRQNAYLIDKMHFFNHKTIKKSLKIKFEAFYRY